MTMGKPAAIDYRYRHFEPHALAPRERGVRDRLRQRQRNILFGDQSLSDGCRLFALQDTTGVDVASKGRPGGLPTRARSDSEHRPA
jgi:hypothetical protein